MAEGQHLNLLTSYAQFYKTFNGNAQNCNNTGAKPDDLDTKLKTTFSDCTNITKDAKKIAHAYCYASWMNGQPNQYKNKEPCEFFYYWLGDTYGNDLKHNHTFSKLLTAIHETLKGDDYLVKCRIKYDDINEALVSHMKRVYEYNYEHEKINSWLLQNGLQCETQWSKYLNEVSSGCEAIRADCKGKNHTNSNTYCYDFHTKYKLPCGIAEALNLYCKEAANLDEGTQHTSVVQKLKAEREDASMVKQQAQYIQLKLDEAVHQANKASSLSSAFGAMALMELPALAYFLYKYKPWSSWFSNHTSGNGGRRSNRRGRRSAGQNFDVSAEDTFTEYSTDTSTTIGPTDPAEHSTTLRSRPPHTIPSTNREGRARANNNTPGHHRNNVGYSRM